MARHKVLLRISEKLTRHSYMRHLLIRYATVALGMLHVDPMPCPGVLVVTVAMLPEQGTPTQRLTIQRIDALPLALLDDLTVQGFDEMCRPLFEGNTAGTQAVRVITTPNVGLHVPRSFMKMEAASVHSDNLTQARQPGFTFDLFSHSFGRTRSFPMDPDVLFRCVTCILVGHRRSLKSIQRSGG